MKLLVKHGKIKIIQKQGKVDKMIVELVEKNPKEWIVCTNDRELIQKIKELGSEVVVISKGRFKFV